MLFKILGTHTFSHDVTVRVPVDGGYEDRILTVTYRCCDAAALASFDLGSIEGQDRFFEACVAGFTNLADEEDRPLPMNGKVRQQVLSAPFVRRAVIDGYVTAMAKARTGN